MELKTDDIQEILRIFAESELEELRLEIGETRLYVSKSSAGGLPEEAPRRIAAPAAPALAAEASQTPATAAPPAAVASAAPVATSSPGGAASAPSTTGQEAAAATQEPPADGLLELRSPLVGVFYRRPSPDQPPFVEVGSEVEPDDPVCIVDVMKMFTRVAAGVRGRVAQICVEDGQLVEHGQVLMRFEPR